jgi:predicted phage terminase large subunit-like protein
MNSTPLLHDVALWEKARREKARRSLLEFVSYTFPAYVRAAHLDKLAGKLEAIERGEIDRLMVFMPPRHGKTELAGIRFPAWYLGRHPDDPVIFASYAASLAHSKSRECRNLIESQAYQNVFGRFSCVDEPVELAEDERAVQAWRIAGHRGGMIAAGVGGGMTGYGAKLLIVDDPHKNRQEANSQTMREQVWGWYTSTARTRPEPGAAIVLIQTRWHPDDLAGRLLKLAETDPKADRWEVLHLPALSEDGQALWPERFPVEELEKTRATIGSWEFEALYQGRPRPLEGALFKREWFRVADRAPEGLTWVRFWDLAVSVKETADFTVGGRAALAEDGTLYIADVVRGRWEWPAAKKIIIQTALADGPGEVGIEKVAFQLAAVQELRQEPALLAHTIREVEPDRDKVARALPWAARAEAGKVVLVIGDWIGDFLAEVCDFPLGEHDDQVDAVSGGVQMLAGRREILIGWA